MPGISIHDGKVSRKSRLYRQLTEKHRSEAMALGKDPAIKTDRLGGSHAVFLITNENSGRKYLLKSFYEHGKGVQEMQQNLNREYDRLKELSKLHVRDRHFRPVKPLCRDVKGLFLVEEYIQGKGLDYYATKSLTNGGNGLYDKLGTIGCFLAKMHTRTQTGKKISWHSLQSELSRHAEQALHAGSIDRGKHDKIRKLIRRWCKNTFVRNARRSLVHGDATVSNFIFNKNKLYVIDLERSGYRDQTYDTGMLAGELFGLAMICTGNPYKADPFIGHMFWSYACNYRDRDAIFKGMTARNPLYMANSLLRMSRNLYHSRDQRQRLAHYAAECLQSPLP